MLIDSERNRYDRQIRIEGIGETGQEKLKNARVLVVGTGGLGTPAALYLAAAGVGSIRIVDNDVVDVSNLNRQILHWTKDIGRLKVESASEKLKGLNDGLIVEPLVETVDEGNAARIISGCDVVVDGTDNIETRFVINDEIIKRSIPFVHGAVYGFQGRVTTVIPGKTACIRCLYRATLPQQKPPVLGVTPGLVGVIQATETIKLLLNLGDVLANRLLVYDGLKMTFSTLSLRKNPSCSCCGQEHPH